jgi:phage terminase large subunit
VKVQIPKTYQSLLTKHYRYKFFYGGRAGGKSWGMADALLLLGRNDKLFIACVREVQNSIKDSVYKLLKDRAEYYGFDDYVFFDDRIENIVTKTRFVFKGLGEHNAQNIKSLEGVDICWCEEAQTITTGSLQILLPTIRKPNSEIWFSMNRKEVNDPAFKMIAANPDDETLVVKVNYYDNPYCPDEIKKMAEKSKRENYDEYLHIWEGEPMQQGDYKLISAKLVREAMVQKIMESNSPLVIGLDIARAGNDKTVFCFRKGRLVVKFNVVKGYDTVEVADLLTSYIKDYKPAKVFLDLGNSGAGVYDILNSRGYSKIVKGVNFGAKAIQSDRYKNKRAEMWDGVRKWLDQDLPVQLPNDDDLLEELSGVERVKVAQDQLQLEDKEEFKKRIGRSPDKADALALTFAEPVYETNQAKLYGSGYVSVEDMFSDSNKGSSSEW